MGIGLFEDTLVDQQIIYVEFYITYTSGGRPGVIPEFDVRDLSRFIENKLHVIWCLSTERCQPHTTSWERTTFEECLLCPNISFHALQIPHTSVVGVGSLWPQGFALQVVQLDAVKSYVVDVIPRA